MTEAVRGINSSTRRLMEVDADPLHSATIRQAFADRLEEALKKGVSIATTSCVPMARPLLHAV